VCRISTRCRRTRKPHETEVARAAQNGCTALMYLVRLCEKDQDPYVEGNECEPERDAARFNGLELKDALGESNRWQSH